MSQVQQRKSTRKENKDFTKAKFKGRRFKFHSSGSSTSSISSNSIFL
jgi:hypothetical protein